MNLVTLLELPSMIAPDDVALIAEGGEWSYADLHHAAEQGAGLLVSHGVTAGDRVGILSTNRPEALEVLFAPAIIGATAVPLNYKAGTDEARHLLTDSAIRVLFAESRYRDLIESVRPPSLDAVYWLDDESSYAAARRAATPVHEAAEVPDDMLAVLLYTSGTTSMPKGVKLTHGALTTYVMGRNDCVDGTAKGRMLLAAPLHHVAGLTSALNALYSGQTVVAIPQFDEASWLRAVAQHQVTQAFLVPTMLARLLTHPDLPSTDLSSLQGITYGAAPMPPSVIRRAIDLFPPTVEFSGSYGQTETTATVCVLEPDDHRLGGTGEERQAKLRRLGSVGRPVDDVRLRVVGPAGDELRSGQIGEILIHTPRAMTGYWGTRQDGRVTIDAGGWMHSGDLGYLDDDGYLFLVGRAGDMIVRGGENVAPAEVEAVLYEHPGVLEAGCVGVPDEEWGERVLAAAVVRGAVTEDDLLSFTKSKLASFKRPERVVILSELPHNSTGKLLRKDLRAMIS